MRYIYCASSMLSKKIMRMFSAVETVVRQAACFKVVTKFKSLYFMILVEQFASLQLVYTRLST